MCSNLPIVPRAKMRFSPDESYKSKDKKESKSSTMNWVERRDAYECSFDSYIPATNGYCVATNPLLDTSRLIQSLNKIVKELGSSCLSDWVLRECLKDHHFSKSVIDEAIAHVQESVRLKERSNKEFRVEYQGWTPKHNIYGDFFALCYIRPDYTDYAKKSEIKQFLKRFVDRFGERELDDRVLFETLREKNVSMKVIAEAIREVRKDIHSSRSDATDSFLNGMMSNGIEIDKRRADKILRDDMGRSIQEDLRRRTESWFNGEFKKSIDKAEESIKKSIGDKAFAELYNHCDSLMSVAEEREEERKQEKCTCIENTKEEEPLIPERGIVMRRIFKEQCHAENLRKVKYGKSSECEVVHKKTGCSEEKTSSAWYMWREVILAVLFIVYVMVILAASKYGILDVFWRTFNWN